MIEIKIQLQPKQIEFKKSIEQYPVTFYGGAKGGGKSHGMRNIFLLRRFEYPGSHAAIFRRTYPELEANHIRPLLEKDPALREYWNESKKLLTLPNGSTLQFCHCKNEVDVSLYQGREYHDLGIEEAGEWTETMISRLRGSNRSSKPGIIPRTALTGNPGGVGHQYLKRIFIDKRYNDRENPADYNFIQAFVRDNNALIDNDPGYIMRLRAEPNQALRKAYMEGNWDIFAGQFFEEISRDVHMVEPFAIPPHWNRFGAYDYGYNHPASFGWFAVDEDGNVYLYRRFTRAKMRADQFAAELKRHEDTKLLYPIVAGHDCWTQKSTLRDDKQPPTVAEQFALHGINLTKATIDRVQGAAQLRDYLAWQGKNGAPNKKPRFYIFKSCQSVFDSISRMIHNPDKPEDVLKVDVTEGEGVDTEPESGDDEYDMVRYGLMSRPVITDPIIIKPAIGSPAWHAKQNEDLFEKALEHFQQEKEREIGGYY